MKSKGVVLIIIISFLTMSCSKSEKDIYYNIIEKLDNNTLITKAKVVLIIPHRGCGECVANAYKFANIYINSNMEFHCIIYGYLSKKELKNEYDQNFLQSKSVTFDNESVFVKNNYSAIYPVAFIIDKKTKEVKSITIESANKNKIYNKLSKYLNNEINYSNF